MSAIKEELRREIRHRLAAIGREARVRAAGAIAERLEAWPELDGGSTVLLFASLPDEVPTGPIDAALRRRGCEVVYPRCLAGGAMTLHVVRGMEEMRSGRYGIREPVADTCRQVRPASIDVAFVPGLAWDRAGGRLGRGGGYYDRLLGAGSWTALACGIFLSAQEVQRVPMDPWDIRLDRVFTELETVRTTPSRPR